MITLYVIYTIIAVTEMLWLSYLNNWNRIETISGCIAAFIPILNFFIVNISTVALLYHWQEQSCLMQKFDKWANQPMFKKKNNERI